VAYSTSDGDNYYRTFKNLISNAVAFTGTISDYNIRFSARLNEYGSYDGSGTATYIVGGIIDREGYRASVSWTEDKTYLDTGEDGVSLKRVIRWSYTSRTTGTYSSTQNERELLGNDGYSCGNISGTGNGAFKVVGIKYHSLISDWAAM